MTPTPEEIKRLAAWLHNRIAGFMWQEGSTPLGAIAAEQALVKFHEIAAALRLLADTMRERDEARRMLAEATTVIHGALTGAAMAQDGNLREPMVLIRQPAFKTLCEWDAARLASQKEPQG